MVEAEGVDGLDREKRYARSARGIAELPLIKVIKLVEQLSLIMDVAWPLTRAIAAARVVCTYVGNV